MSAAPWEANDDAVDAAMEEQKDGPAQEKTTLALAREALATMLERGILVETKPGQYQLGDPHISRPPAASLAELVETTAGCAPCAHPPEYVVPLSGDGWMCAQCQASMPQPSPEPPAGTAEAPPGWCKSRVGKAADRGPGMWPGHPHTVDCDTCGAKGMSPCSAPFDPAMHHHATPQQLRAYARESGELAEAAEPHVKGGNDIRAELFVHRTFHLASMLSEQVEQRARAEDDAQAARAALTAAERELAEFRAAHRASNVAC